jgi:hypothetical protein
MSEVKILKNPKISKAIKQKALFRRILKLRLKSQINKIIHKMGYDFVVVKDIDIDIFHLDDYWNNQYKEIKETYK